MGLSGLNQYKAKDKESGSKIKHSTSGEAQTGNPLFTSRDWGVASLSLTVGTEA